MNNIYIQKVRAFTFFSFLLIFSFNAYCQVGIGTVNPDPSAVLDITSSAAAPGGLLLPRVALLATNDASPLPANVAGMAIYNTATAGTSPNNVTPGYYYNDGSVWVRIAAEVTPTADWALSGNAGTNANLNFLGTIDNIALRLRTTSFNRFEVTNGTTQANGGRLRAFTNGTAAQPIYSWNANAGTGMYQQASNVLGFSTNAVERFRIPNAEQVHAVLNGTAALPFYSWSNNTNLGMYRISANTLGFSALQTSINGAPLFAGDRFTVNGADTESVINGYSSNGFGVFGSNSISGTGVYGENLAGAGNGVFGFSSDVGVRGQGGLGVLGEGGNGGFFVAQSNTGFGVIAINTTTSGANRTGLLAVGQGLGLATFPNSGAVLYGSGFGGGAFANSPIGTGFAGVGNAGTTAQTLTNGSGLSGTGQTGVYGRSVDALGTGIIGVGNNSLIINTIVGGSGIAGTGTKYGVYGYATETGVNNPNNNTPSSAGGYFANANATNGFSAVAAWADSGDLAGTDQLFKIIGTGVVSTIVKDGNEIGRIMYAPEAPESLFQDYGVGKLVNGTATVQLDPILSKNIRVDETHPLKVFIQLEGDCNGVYVTNKSSNSFTVKELQGGSASVSFSWSIVATRADEVFYNAEGQKRVSHNDQRFPIAPQAEKLMQQNSVEVKATMTDSKDQVSSTFNPVDGISKPKFEAKADVPEAANEQDTLKKGQ